jgi:hypothetical protein
MMSGNAFKTQICTVEQRDGFQIYFDTERDKSKAHHLFLNFHGNALAILESFSGPLHPDLHPKLLNSISRDVAALGAYLEPYDEDFPDEIGYVFEDETGRHAHRHIFRDSNSGVVLHLTVLENFDDSDIEKYRELMQSIQFDYEYSSEVNPGERIAFQTQLSTSLVMVGQRAYWDDLPKLLSEVAVEG